MQVARARHGGQRGGPGTARVVDQPGAAGKPVKGEAARLLILDVALDRPAVCPLDLARPFLTGEEVPHVVVIEKPPAEEAVHVALYDLLVGVSADHRYLPDSRQVADVEVVVRPL